MVALPERNSMVVPIQWTGKTQKTVMEAAGYSLGGTIGWRPYTETATLTWIVSPATADTLLETFKATNMNGVYDYTCLVRGAIRVRLTGDYELEETNEYAKVKLSVGVKVV